MSFLLLLIPALKNYISDILESFIYYIYLSFLCLYRIRFQLDNIKPYLFKLFYSLTKEKIYKTLSNLSLFLFFVTFFSCFLSVFLSLCKSLHFALRVSAPYIFNCSGIVYCFFFGISYIYIYLRNVSNSVFKALEKC